MYSKGISWIDDCRIPFVDGDKPKGGFGAASIGYGNEYEYDGRCNEANTQGRFPANLLVSDDMLNDGVISKSQENKSKGNIRKSLINGAENAGGFYRPDYFVQRNGFNDKGTNSRYYDIDCWFNNLIDV